MAHGGLRVSSCVVRPARECKLALGTRLAGEPPGVMDLVGRAKGFLILHEGADFCDECMGRALGITAAQARTIVVGLAKSAAILRDRWTCKWCGTHTSVTRAVPNATFALNRRSRSRLRRIA